MGLDVALVVPRRAERVLEHPVRGVERRRPLAISSDLHHDLALDVGVGDRWPGSTQVDVFVGRRVQDGGVVGQCSRRDVEAA